MRYYMKNKAFVAFLFLTYFYYYILEDTNYGIITGMER